LGGREETSEEGRKKPSRFFPAVAKTGEEKKKRKEE